MLSRIPAFVTAALVLCTAACGGDGGGGRDAAANVLVVRNGTVVDGTGAGPIADGVVLIEAGKIVAVGPADEVEVPEGAREIDAAGGSILPGLIDTHVHLFFGGKVFEPALQGYLRKGVTTLRDVGSAFGTPKLPFSELRRRLDALRGPLPTILAAGPMITRPGGWPNPIGGGDIALELEGAEAVEREAARLLDEGVDGLKVALAEFYGDQRLPRLAAEEIAAAVRPAHARGAWVSAHVATTKDAEIAIAGGVDDLAHFPLADEPGRPMSDEFIRTLVEADVPIVTTLALYDRVLPPDEKRLLAREVGGSLRRLLDAGVTVAFGTDGPGLGPSDPAEELQKMVEFGMTPAEAIVAATRNAAEVCGLDDVGTLEPGQVADVIVVGGDAVSDVAAIANVVAVVKAGRRVSLAESP